MTRHNLIIKNKGWAQAYDIGCKERDVLDTLATLFGYDISQDVPCGEPTIKITVDIVNDCYRLRCNGYELFTSSPIQEILNIIFRETDFSPFIFPMHAGAVEANGKAHLFLAKTGMGKTTLTAYLTKQGYSYVNDDCILINMNTLYVVVDSSSLHLRPESISVLNHYGYEISGTEVKTEGIHRIVYTPQCTKSDFLPIGNIFFLERSQSENFCQPMPKEKAVQQLMESLISPKANDINRLKCAIRLAEYCKRLVYSDMQYVADLLEQEKGF